jgi:hypothetical protein
MPDRLFQRRAISLTWRLVTGYTLAALLTLSVAGFFLHRRLRQQFELEDSELLLDSVVRVRDEVNKDPRDLKAAADYIMDLAGTRNLEKYYGRLLDPAGRVLLETPGMDVMAPPPSKFPRPKDTRNEGISGVSDKGTPALMVSGEVPRGDNGETLIYQVALDSAHVEEWMEDYRNYLYLVVGGTCAATAILGWFITRTYHLYQLPLLSRKLRVVADWTTSLFFRRDIAELSMLGHPERLDA